MAVRFAALALALLSTFSQAAEVTVAVAANFTAPMQKIAQSFEQDTGHKAVLAFGSTGNLYAQVRHGAPFHVLLAADDETPLRMEKEGLGIAGTRSTYAIGRLVLWSRQPGALEALRSGSYQRLAIANPKLAPYGAAAVEVLDRMGLAAAARPKIVQGENIAQAFQFVATQNAQLGFVALSQVTVDGRIAQGSGWVVPGEMHQPIRQDAILLAAGRDNAAATALLAYLKGDKARAVIRSHGYDL
jgi:molybdate transport system substrate-binding protein